MKSTSWQVGWVALLTLATCIAQADVASPVALRDQYGKRRVLAFPREKVSVLLIADREGSSGLGPWVESIYERYEDSVAIEGVALLKGVPRPLRGLVARLFRRAVPYPVMLDWSNETAAPYTFDPNTPNVFVIAQDGRIHLRISGPSDAANVTRCLAGIEEILGQTRMHDDARQ